MKFCKNLQRMIDLSDPEWAPYYTNYKMLKKLIKELPHENHSKSKDINIRAMERKITIDEQRQYLQPEIDGFVARKNVYGSHSFDDPSDATTSPRFTIEVISSSTELQEGEYSVLQQSRDDSSSAGNNVVNAMDDTVDVPKQKQACGETPAENSKTRQRLSVSNRTNVSDTTPLSTETNVFLEFKSKPVSENSVSASTTNNAENANSGGGNDQPTSQQRSSLVLVQQLRQNPTEVEFFRLLHSEVRKVSFFYHQMINELYIRFERVHDTVQQLLILQNDTSKFHTLSKRRLSFLPYMSTTTGGSLETASNQGKVASKNYDHNNDYFLCIASIYKLSRDLMLLESYCIMAFTSFSKILKKHDKVTGYDTKNSFMTKIVIPSNFVATNHTLTSQQQDLSIIDSNLSGNGARLKRSISLNFMIEQCTEWYSNISSCWVNDDADNERPPPPSNMLNQGQRNCLQNDEKDECLFLYMIQHFRK